MIFLIILLIILFVLFISVGIRVKYIDDFELYFCVMFLKFKIKPKEKKEVKKESEPRKKEIKKKEEKFFDEIKDVLELIKTLSVPIKKFIKKTKLSYMLDVKVATEDAAETGILFGRIMSVSQLLIISANELFNLKRQKVSITPDFYHSKTEIKADITIKTRVLTLLITGIKVLMLYMKSDYFKRKETVKNG